ncbi:MAG TPA: CHAT domain-containing protein [Herpetosiphon sp.]|uniref:CHAT domain-containing protein n=2 Tax=Herpetosiphon TaxID=64 RepID=A9AVD6_HERA2|nr:conserved hypothetical protein [Herpetosiphon aurantiacus DSM 785]HBW48661.1 CHAT domain-containing protein [Herpetosiphon sp.]
MLATPLPMFARIIRLVDQRPLSALVIAHRRLLAMESSACVDHGWAWFCYGWAALHGEKVSEGLAALQQAQALFAQHHDQAGMWDCRQALLVGRWLQGEGVSLQQAWQPVIEAHLRLGGARAAAEAQIYQLIHLNYLKRYQAVLDLAATIAPHLTTAPQFVAGRFMRIVAIANAGLGAFTKAKQGLDQALYASQQAKAWVDVAKCLRERGFIADRQEHYADAVADLQQAMTWFNRLGMPLYAALCQRALGLALSRIGHYDQGLRFNLAARSSFRMLDRPDLAAGCDQNIGVIAHYVRLPLIAQSAYQRALAVYQARSSTYDSCVLQRNFALLQINQGNGQLALDLLGAIQPLVLALDDQLELGEFYEALAQAWHCLGAVDQAQRFFDQAIVCFEAIGNQINIAKCQLGQAWLMLETGNWQLAQALLAQAQVWLLEHPTHRWRCHYGLGYCAAQAGASGRAMAEYIAACGIVAQLRQALSSEHASSAIFAQAQQLYHDTIRLALAQANSNLAWQLIEQQRALVLNRQMRCLPLAFDPDLAEEDQRYHARLSSLTQPTAGHEHVEALFADYINFLIQARHTLEGSLADLAIDRPLEVVCGELDEAFDGDWTWLGYSQLGDDLLIITLYAGQITVIRQPIDRRFCELLGLANSFTDHSILYEDWSFLSQAAPFAELRALSDRLIPSVVKQRLHQNHRLLITPCTKLHQVAWAALLVNQQRLCQTCIPQIIPSLGTWSWLQARQSLGTEALLLGCDNFGERADALPHIQAELRVVAQQVTIPVSTLFGAEATGVAVLKLGQAGLLQRFRHIHIATHAQLIAARGLLAHIKLVDGDMFYNDILNLRLAGATVVLSTCDGSLSETLLGEEVLSLSRAFLAGGAREVLANGWKTSDSGVVELMRLFYHYLAYPNDGATALAMAQRTLLESDDPSQAAVLVWGGFQVVGAGTLAQWPSAQIPSISVGD